MNLDENKLSSRELARKASREIHRSQNDNSGKVSLNKYHKGPSMNYVSMLLAFLDPTHPPFQQTSAFPHTLKYRIKELARLLIFNILPPMLTLILPCSFINFWILTLLLVYLVFPKKTHGTATL